MNNRSRTDSSAISSIDPIHYQALQDTNEALKSEVHRLALADDDNTTKLKLQVIRILFFLSCFWNLHPISINSEKNMSSLAKPPFSSSP
jgi:hypothetical protein